MNVVAERTFEAKFPDGVIQLVTLRLGQPFMDEKGHFACTAQAEGLRLWDGPDDFYGVDSWHALLLAIRFLHTMLKEEVDRGAELWWEKMPISVDELFVLHEIK